MLPTKLTAAMSGCSSSASTASLSPCSTVNTPSGSPAFCNNSAMNRLALGSFSLGFRMKAFPQASAFAIIHSGTIAGKLNGVMPATTPSGCWMEYTSTPVLAPSEYPPLSRLGIPHAKSTFSMPRAISPSASACTFPCSRVRMRARSSRPASSSARKRNMISARLLSGTIRHARAAAVAA